MARDRQDRSWLKRLCGKQGHDGIMAVDINFLFTGKPKLTLPLTTEAIRYSEKLSPSDS